MVKGKKKRLVLDFRHVNKFLHEPKFRYENLDSLSQVVETGDWFFNWDLKSCKYLSAASKIFGFQLGYKRSSALFCVQSLPFGLSTASFCFEKLLKPFSTRWRSLSRNCFIYIDDGISRHRTKSFDYYCKFQAKVGSHQSRFHFKRKM